MLSGGHLLSVTQSYSCRLRMRECVYDKEGLVELEREILSRTVWLTVPPRDRILRGQSDREFSLCLYALKLLQVSRICSVTICKTQQGAIDPRHPWNSSGEREGERVSFTQVPLRAVELQCDISLSSLSPKQVLRSCRAQC